MFVSDVEGKNVNLRALWLQTDNFNRKSSKFFRKKFQQILSKLPFLNFPHFSTHTHTHTYTHSLSLSLTLSLSHSGKNVVY